MGVVPAQVFGNLRTHAPDVRQHLVVPKTWNPVARFRQETAPFRFLRRRSLVLAAIDFDNQARIVANEVGNAAPERRRPAAPMPLDLTGSQDSPEAPLCFGHIAS